MASAKRKAVTDERPSQKLKKSKGETTFTSKQRNNPRNEDSNDRKPVSKSVLQQEEKAFPRGGASVLTPLEQKQIKAQAEKDVLFEQQTGQVVGEEDANPELSKRTQNGLARSKKKIKRRRESSDALEKIEKHSVKIQGLNSKSLVVGSVVLGYVIAITSRDAALSLANNLTGYVPITAVSERLNTRIESLLEDETDAKNGGEDEEDVELKKLFHVGQWLRAAVTAIGSESSDSSGKSKRHIELSVDPKQVNPSLDSNNVVTHSMIQASVRSVEDHGIVVDLGLSDPDLKGFISKKDIGPTYQLDKVQEGQVIMCAVTGKGSNGKILKLSPDVSRFAILAEGKATPSVSEAPNVEGFQPGTAVDVLVTESGASGVAGKIMGMLDVAADAIHCGAGSSVEDISKKYKVGSKAKGRIIWTIPMDDNSRRIGVSFLDHMVALPSPLASLPANATAKMRVLAAQLEETLPLSIIFELAKVKHVLGERGLFMTLPQDPKAPISAFAYIAQISDSRIDALTANTGPYKLESTHRARVLSYNPIDNLHYVSLKQSILEQPFLRIEDLTVGELVKGTVERLVLGKKGVNGILIKLSDSINGLVPELHISDVQLQHPERKFKEGFRVQARVLSVDLEKRYVRLTLKKSLVNRDDAAPIWKDYLKLQPGLEGKGTIVNLLHNGAAVQFFGNVRAWLPAAEMSETYIDKPEKHFRLGQTIDVRILSVDPDAQEMKVSCKSDDSSAFEQPEAWNKATGGRLVSGTVVEKNVDGVVVELEDGLKGLIRIRHLTDGSLDSAEKALKKLHVGQTLSRLVVLDKLERSRHLLLSKKKTLVDSAENKMLIRSVQDVRKGQQADGFVRNVTPEGVYVEFANGVVALLPKSQLLPEMLSQPAFGLAKDQSLHTWIMSMNSTGDKFTLSMREQLKEPPAPKPDLPEVIQLSNAVDNSIATMADFTLGKVTKARIVSVKGTQLNVQLADNVQGRIDVSEAFDSWDEITSKWAPLQKYKVNEVLDVKILGVHDARNHRFLPISHRQSSVPVFELSSKRSRIEHRNDDALTMDSIKSGSNHLAFINNHGDNCVWVNISPNVRGRISLMDLSDDVGQLQNLNKNFPIGRAVLVTVKSVDAASNRLDLVAKSGRSDGPLTLQDVSAGTILGGRITKVTERSVQVQLSEHLAGPVPLVEVADDYDQLNLATHQKNDIVRVCVVDIDAPNKRIFLSLRPSKVLSSSLPVKDPQVTSYGQLKPGQIVRGFVKHIGDKGVYVSLGARVDAFVRVSDLSDKYVKDWKSILQLDQLVRGRISSVDADSKLALLSLKDSQLGPNYTPPTTINDLRVGETVTGKVRKVEEFGAFIDIDNTKPRLSGLCHRSEIAEKRIEDVRKLYSEGDIVKARILSVDVGPRKISLGLKASYFKDDIDDADAGAMEEDEDDSGIEVNGSEGGLFSDEDDDDMDVDGGIGVAQARNLASGSEDDSQSEAEAMDIEQEVSVPSAGLKTSGFDWAGLLSEPAAEPEESDSELNVSATKKRKRHKPEIKVDLTGDLDKFGPRSEGDFERQLIGQPNHSALWVRYMAFQLQLSEIQKARDIAERALRTIHIRETEEKANIWIAKLNLEVAYGDDDGVEDVFKQACQVQDPLEMHEKLASIYIDSGTHEKADDIFNRIVSNKVYRASPEVWLNYANFLMDTLKEPERARSLLSRALQSVPSNEHRLLTAKFAAMEFRSPSGDAERGRTIFEGLVSEWPNWSSGWDMFVDLERARLAAAESREAKAEARAKIRALYERMSAQKMKKRRAKFVFKRWLDFEEAEGNEKSVERVKALAKAWVKSQQTKGAGDE